MTSSPYYCKCSHCGELIDIPPELVTDDFMAQPDEDGRVSVELNTSEPAYCDACEIELGIIK